jgi:hypothetical protein
MRLVAADEQRWKHRGKASSQLLTHSQLAFHFDWHELTLEAGLEISNVAPDAGLSWVASIELFLTEMGYFPSGDKMLSRFARDKGFGIARTNGEGTKSVRPAIREVQERWKVLGRWCPEGPAEKAQRPKWNVVPFDQTETPARRKRKTPWTFDECFASVETAARELAGKPLTQKTYRAHAIGRPDLAPMSVVLRCAQANGTTFTEMRDTVRRRQLAALTAGNTTYA